MRNIVISLCILGLFLEISGLIWSSKKEQASETFMKLSEVPIRSIENPLENGYFLLLGFASSAGSSPVQVGYDIWLESEVEPSRRGFDFEKAGRSELCIPVAFDQVLPEWNTSNPVDEFQRHDALYRTSVNRYNTLMKRYQQWLMMRFEDWGYAHSGVPRIDDLLAAHRLFIAEGFGHQITVGLERLGSDIARWRSVLRDARTLPMKLMAEVMLEDDVQLLSRILSQTAVDPVILARGLKLLQPLTPSEYSLRYPVQSQFMLGYTRGQRYERDAVPHDDINRPSKESLARAAHLQPEMFRAVEHPRLRSFLGFSPSSQRIWDTYAAFYDATIKASDSVHSPLPKLHDIARHSQMTVLERIVNPLEFSPNWEPFSQRLVETDARMRLVSLQILMRKPTATVTIPTRLAEVGSMYFDPFTGLPMLWSPTQKKLYSVGKDGLDDGGDPTFDISVPLALAVNASPSGGSSSVRQ